MKILWLLRKNILFLVPVLCGLALIASGLHLEKEEAQTYADGLLLHQAAFAALERENHQAAYELFVQSFFYSQDPEIRAYSLYNAANLAWEEELSDYNTLVALYKESLRNAPGFYEAGFNLEYLYMLKENAPEMIPIPGGESGEEEDDGRVRGPEI